MATRTARALRCIHEGDGRTGSGLGCACKACAALGLSWISNALGRRDPGGSTPSSGTNGHSPAEGVPRAQNAVPGATAMDATCAPFGSANDPMREPVAESSGGGTRTHNLGLTVRSPSANGGWTTGDRERRSRRSPRTIGGCIARYRRSPRRRFRAPSVDLPLTRRVDTFLRARDAPRRWDSGRCSRVDALGGSSVGSNESGHGGATARLGPGGRGTESLVVVAERDVVSALLLRERPERVLSVGVGHGARAPHAAGNPVILRAQRPEHESFRRAPVISRRFPAR